MGNHRQQPPAGAARPPPPSPTPKATSKYTNKDGSKFITVPKASSSTTDSAQPSPSLDPSQSLDPSDTKAAAHSDQGGPGSPAPAQPVTINRRKQKRREKEAHKKALAEQTMTKEGPPSPTGSDAPSHDRRSLDVEHDFSEADVKNDHRGVQMNAAGESSTSKKSKKKKKKAADAGADDTQSHNDYHDHDDHVHHHERSHNHAPHPPPVHRGSGVPKEKLWNMSGPEERARIKAFWLELGEDERKSLVKVEKDAVLKKMKEQQKQTCSCTVCGRKRTAIEEELEGLYDAYYEELEQYAHHPNQNGEGPPMMGSPKHLGPASNRTGGPPSNYAHQPSHGRIVEHVSDDEDEEEEDFDSEEEDHDDDEGLDEGEPAEVVNRNEYNSEFFAFGNSLTVQGGILTVADDLLKNDGRKFIEMMEQLAERRMAREEEARAAFRDYGHPNGDGYGHSHPPPDEEDDYDDEEEDYEEEDEDGYDSVEEEDAMTEEQRMEEGRRMFQIFAARMFEQRVQTAYKEKVAKERQNQLIREVEEEAKLEEQRQQKKAKEAQKRKEKAAKKKAALAEEKSRKEEEKAEEERRKAQELREKADEQRKKAEEKRKAKEAQKQAEDEERLRKEADRQRRIHEQKEQERKAREAKEQKVREAKEKEKKAKEDAARQKEKEAREKKEAEARERKERLEREAKSAAEREAAQRVAQEQLRAQRAPKQPAHIVQKPATAPPTATPITVVRRPPQPPIPTAVPPALPQQPAISVAAVASPQKPIATPAIPKAPLTMRNRQPSQQESTSGSSQSTARSESNPSQAPSPHPLTPLHTSPGPLGPNSKTGAQHPSQGASPMNIPARANAAPQYGGYPSSPMMPYGQLPPGMPQLPHGYGSPIHSTPGFPASPFTNYSSPHIPGLPGGINRSAVPRPFGQTGPPPGFRQPFEPSFPGTGHGFPTGPARDSLPLHQRQPSLGDFDHQSPSGAAAQPFVKPLPIGRPPSVTPGQQRPTASLPSGGWGATDAENGQLGSKALLADSEEAPGMPAPTRRNTSVPGGLPPPNMYMEHGSGFANNIWASPIGQGFYGSPPPNPPPGLTPQTNQWAQPTPMTSAFGVQNGVSRQALRLLLCRACKTLAESRDTPAEDVLPGGYVSLRAAKIVVDDHLIFSKHQPTTIEDLKDFRETLGTAGNGGGIIETTTSASGGLFVRWIPDPANGVEGVFNHHIQPAIGARVQQQPGGQIGSSAAAVGSGYSNGQGAL